MAARIIPFTPPEGQGPVALDNTPVSKAQATVLRKALKEAARIQAKLDCAECGRKADGRAVAGMEGELNAEFFIAFRRDPEDLPARLYGAALVWLAARGKQGLPVPWEAELLEAVHSVESRLSMVRGYLRAVTRLAEIVESHIAPMVADKLRAQLEGLHMLDRL
jgi:hypothetical protein